VKEASAQRGTVVIVGAGPGIGLAVARRFGAEGHAVGLVARSRERLEEHVRELVGEGLAAAAATADIRESDALRGAIRDLAAALGPVEVLCFSPLPRIELIKPVAETTAEDLADALALNVVGAAAAVGVVLPGMREARRGTVLLTTGGAAVAPSADRAVSGVVYGAETVYGRMLHDALADAGIHVGVTTIVGAVGPGKQHEPADVAEALWRQHRERDEAHQVIR
jgi:NADP-dependent 3-hydroxy acid dehydrogenase YdfG